MKRILILSFLLLPISTLCQRTIAIKAKDTGFEHTLHIDGNKVGTVSWIPSINHPGGAHVYSLFVEPAHRNSDNGSYLLNATIEHLKNRGFDEVTLERGPFERPSINAKGNDLTGPALEQAQQKLKRFYKKHGFEEDPNGNNMMRRYLTNKHTLSNANFLPMIITGCIASWILYKIKKYYEEKKDAHAKTHPPIPAVPA
jgi:GNAT superfamily N-acetyltransferase